MATSRGSQNKAPKYLDTKVLIASLSIAVTVGMWNLFSNEAVLATKVDAGTDQSSNTSTNDGSGLPPLPTLVPTVDLSTIQMKGPAAVTDPVQPSGLRSVAAPDQVIVQKVKPVFEQGGTTIISGGGGGGGSSRPAAVTQTKSSRK